VTDPISTDRLVLTPLRVEDADEMAAVLAADDLYTFIGGTPPTAEQLRHRYGRQVTGGSEDERWHNWIVRTAGEAVGYVQATVAGGQAEIAWVIGEPWQGNGYAAEAATAVVGWLGGQGVERVVAHVHPDHEASNGVARRLGLQPTGDFHDGERRWALDLSRPSTAAG
jgi:RimJ/RimL family protein N-acetyltransferase